MGDSSFQIEKSADGSAEVVLGGAWKVGRPSPPVEEATAEIRSSKPPRATFNSSGIEEWDSTLLIFVTKILAACRSNNIAVDTSGLPEGATKLLALAAPENQRSGMTQEVTRQAFLERIGEMTVRLLRDGRGALSFVGEVTLALLTMIRGKANFRRIDFILTVQETGALAFPIISLISLLIGMILSFIAAIVLRLFGAQIYVADVVGIGVVRVIGAVMAGVIMAGRSGAAFAAQLGTMQANEEVDALETLGISPIEFLVLPRMLALTLMMPLLCVYADVMGVLGGLIIGVGMLHLGAVEYLNETKSALNLTHFFVGLFHSFVFGVLISLAGCLRGIQCERSASAVGYAATSAVVTAIVWMVIATFIITFVCQVFGI